MMHMHDNQNSPPRDRLIRRREVENLTGLGCARIYELMNHPDAGLRLPKPIRIGERCVHWSENAIFEWIERQKARAALAA